MRGRRRGLHVHEEPSCGSHRKTGKYEMLPFLGAVKYVETSDGGSNAVGGSKHAEFADK